MRRGQPFEYQVIARIVGLMESQGRVLTTFKVWEQVWASALSEPMVARVPLSVWRLKIRAWFNRPETVVHSDGNRTRERIWQTLPGGIKVRRRDMRRPAAEANLTLTTEVEEYVHEANDRRAATIDRLRLREVLHGEQLTIGELETVE